MAITILTRKTKAIVPGRAFVRRMHDATLGVRKPHHSIRVNQ